jgi:hypothetical protein
MGAWPAQAGCRCDEVLDGPRDASRLPAVEGDGLAREARNQRAAPVLARVALALRVAATIAVPASRR